MMSCGATGSARATPGSAVVPDFADGEANGLAGKLVSGVGVGLAAVSELSAPVVSTTKGVPDGVGLGLFS